MVYQSGSEPLCWPTAGLSLKAEADMGLGSKGQVLPEENWTEFVFALNQTASFLVFILMNSKYIQAYLMLTGLLENASY